MINLDDTTLQSDERRYWIKKIRNFVVLSTNPLWVKLLYPQKILGEKNE
jgi:hypothetical protein